MNYALETQHDLMFIHAAELKDNLREVARLQCNIDCCLFFPKPCRSNDIHKTAFDEVTYWSDFIEGDLDALSILFLHYAKGLVSYGMKICRDEELVKDSIQEVFIQLIQKRHKLDRNNNIKGLVYRLLRNKIIDEIKIVRKSRKIDNFIFTSANSFEIDAESQSIYIEEDKKRNSMLTSALDQLSVHQKEAMFLKYSDGLNYEQISEVMGISKASSRTLIYRTLKQIKSILIGETSNFNKLQAVYPDR